MLLVMVAFGLILAVGVGATLWGPPEPSAAGPPPEVWALVQEDVERRGEDGALLRLTSAEAMDWLDSCLGLGGPDQICAQVIVPGYRVLVTLAGTAYEYRTDAPPDWIGGRQARRTSP